MEKGVVTGDKHLPANLQSSMYRYASLAILISDFNRRFNGSLKTFICYSKRFGWIQVVRGKTMDVCAKPLRYELLAEVGEGSYGKVFKAREEGQQQRLLAVKKFNVRGDASEVGIPAVMIREVALLRKMKYFDHPNIVQ